MVSDTLDIEAGDAVLKKAQVCTGAHINKGKSICLQQNKWRGKSRLASSDFYRLTEGPLKVLGTQYGSRLQVERNS